MKKAWVLKREWKRKESGACLKMEQKNKTHPSLPSNYVTLAQLHERWLKQQNQIKQQEEEDKEEQQKQHQQQQQQQQEEKHVAVVAPTNVTVSRSHPAEQYRRKNRNDSGTNNRRADEVASENRRISNARAGIGENRRKSEARTAIGENRRKMETGAAIGENRRKSEAGTAIGENRRKMETGAATGENRLKSEAGAGKGDEKADLDGKVGESKKKKKWNKKWKGKMKPKVEERGTIEEKGTAAQGNEVTEKTTTESRLNDEKNDNTTKVEEVEQKIGGLSINPRNGKGKMKPKVEERGTIEEEEEGAAAQGNEVAEKTTTESELNDEKNVNTTKVEEVEQKIGGLSINPRNDKQNWGFRRMNDGFRHFQPRRNYRAGSKQQQRSGVRSIWVRKDGGVGEIEP